MTPCVFTLMDLLLFIVAGTASFLFGLLLGRRGW